MDTSDLANFVQIAEAGSLSEAARRLGTSPAAASRRLAALESALGVRLMHRTTRSVSLTADGELFLPHAQGMVELEAAARASLAPNGMASVSGLLRVTAPAAFGRKIVAPQMPEFVASHPDLQVDLQLTDSVVDIVSAGIDLAVRIGRLRESSLVARKLAPNRRLLCASSSYLAHAGIPRTLEDLRHHECLVLSGTQHWPFQDNAGQIRDVRIKGRFASSSVEALHAACVGGLGLALLSDWDVGDELEAGTLVEVNLGAALPQELGVWAVTPTLRHMPPKVRAFATMLARTLGRRANV